LIQTLNQKGAVSPLCIYDMWWSGGTGRDWMWLSRPEH